MEKQEKAQKLAALAQQIKVCQKCPLFKGTTNPVPGDGNPDAKVMFIGEAPGFHEDQQGLPFVGRAGQLLNRSLAEIKLKREDVFIGNMIKHRPPENRDPLPDEIQACQSYLVKQIDIIKPTIIATLGRFAMEYFLKGEKISKIHGQPRWVMWQERRLLIAPFFHPAAALRNPHVMRQFNEDMKKLPHIIDALESGLVPQDEVSQVEPQKNNQPSSV